MSWMEGRSEPLPEHDGLTTSDGGYRVTVVDDSQDFVSMLSDVLAGRYVVTGLQPRSIDEIVQTDPHLLMVDVHPRNETMLNGWQVVEQARAHDLLRRVPIILFAADLNHDGNFERARRYPGVHLLAKPFSLDVLDATLALATASMDGT